VTFVFGVFFVVSEGLGHCPIQRSDGVHFFTKWPFPSGQQYTALKVVAAILPHLPKAKIKCPWRNCTWYPGQQPQQQQPQQPQQQQDDEGVVIACPPQHELGGVRLAGHIVGYSKTCPSIATCCAEARQLGATLY
jgi:hypothetical protein